jgi:arabinofuranosyltransferase
MHARLLLPDLLAFVAPVAVVAVAMRTFLTVRAAAPAALAMLVVAWAPKSALSLRVSHENQCGIGDEHGWYLRMAARTHAVTVAEYRKHPFFLDPKRMAPSGLARTLYAENETRALANRVDDRVDRALFAGAIGIVGFSLPSTVHVIDKHGLADPIASRFALGGRGRPGHEKELTNAWVVARFGAPSQTDPSDVLAARAALACGEAADLLRSVDGPLTAGAFAHNIVRAAAHSRLRIPTDPFVAEGALCGRPLAAQVKGGPGGAPFTWMCPEGTYAMGLRLTEKEAAVASVTLLCHASRSDARTFGERGEAQADLACPAGATLRGLFGRADTAVHEVGLVCTLDGRETRVPPRSTHPETAGAAFEIACPSGERVGIAGRSGSLVDAVGVACGR